MEAGTAAPGGPDGCLRSVRDRDIAIGVARAGGRSGGRPRWCGSWTRSAALPIRNSSWSCSAGRRAASRASGAYGWSFEMAHAGKMKWDQRAGPAANAGASCRAVSAPISPSVREFLAKTPHPPKLHRLRLASKRLRYTLELFRPCYPAGFEDRIRRAQETAGLAGRGQRCGGFGPAPARRAETRSKGAQVPGRPGGGAGGNTSGHWKEIFDAPAAKPGGRIS